MDYVGILQLMTAGHTPTIIKGKFTYPERNESFKEAMFQAIAYAVFIRELIHTPHGSKWMEIWGINDNKTSGITIIAVVAIPVSNETIPDFREKSIKLGNGVIELHYMALGRDILDADGAVCFETSLKN